MDHVGAVCDEGRGEAPAGQGDADLGAAGERQGGDPDDRARGVRVRAAAGHRSGGDDEREVTAVHEVPGGLERAVGHAVHIRGKGFGHDDDTHTGVVALPDVPARVDFDLSARGTSHERWRRTRAGQTAVMAA